MRHLLFLLCAALLTASCATNGQPQSNLPGRLSLESANAPRFSPPPSPRGVAPVFVSVPGTMVCGDPRLIGRKIGSINGTHPACGISEPVSITAVAGVSLNRAIRVNCETAKALADWTEGAAKAEAQRILTTSLVSIQTAAAYACRPRNSRKGAQISEHGKGNAVDISGFTFADGKTLTVRNDWRASGNRRTYMRSIWKQACGTFGTVLGPESDRHHQDHFHFDTAKHGNGPYCR